MFFILIGICGAYGNGLFGAVYLLALRSRGLSSEELRWTLFFIALYEFSYSLFLLNLNLLGVVAVAVVGAAQYLSSKATRRSEMVIAHVLKTYVPDNEGPQAVGKALALVVLIALFLLCFTPLKEMSIWHKLLFTLPTPISTYFSVSLLAMPGIRLDR